MTNQFFLIKQGANLIQAKVALPSSSAESPVKAFIQLEYYSVICIVQTVHRSLAQLSKVIRGTLLLTTGVQKLAESLLRQEVSTKNLVSFIVYSSSSICKRQMFLVTDISLLNSVKSKTIRFVNSPNLTLKLDQFSLHQAIGSLSLFHYILLWFLLLRAGCLHAFVINLSMLC